MIGALDLSRNVSHHELGDVGWKARAGMCDLSTMSVRRSQGPRFWVFTVLVGRAP